MTSVYPGAMYSLASLNMNTMYNRINVNVRQRSQLIENSLSPGLGFPARRGREGEWRTRAQMEMRRLVVIATTRVTSWPQVGSWGFHNKMADDAMMTS